MHYFITKLMYFQKNSFKKSIALHQFYSLNKNQVLVYSFKKESTQECNI